MVVVPVERILASVLVLFAFLGPWTRHVAVMFGLAEFERTSVIDMTLYMLTKIPESFLLGAAYFVAVPILLLLLRYFFPRAANIVHYCLTMLLMVLSVCALPIFFAPGGDSPRNVVNVMGEIFVADLVVMFAWHAVLCLCTRALPTWSLAFGPLFGLGQYLFIEEKRPSSIAGGVAALYLCIGGLYRGYRLIETQGHNVFTNTVPFDEWYGYELYALFSIGGGFLLLCASTPVPRRFIEFVEVVLYLVLVNANVGAGWIASRGVVRPRLVTPRRPFRLNARDAS